MKNPHFPELSLSQLLDAKIPSPDYFLPPLIPTAATTIAFSSPGVLPLTLATLAAYAVAAALPIKSLEVFGRCSTGRATFFAPAHQAQCVQAAFKRLSEKQQPAPARALAADNLTVSLIDPGEDHGLGIDVVRGLRLQAGKPTHQLWVIYDLATWFDISTSAHAIRQIADQFAELNKRGITILAFRNDYRKREKWIEAFPALNVLRLASGNTTCADHNAIRIFRQSNHYPPSSPSPLDFTYTSAGPLSFEFSAVDSTQLLSPKQQEIRQRRLQIPKLLQQGISRSEIAVRLGVSVATLSRDIAERPPLHEAPDVGRT